MNVTIYALCCPTTKEVKYVGKTIDLVTRIKCHLVEKSNSYKRNWIISLKRKSLRPEVRVLEIINNSDDKDWQQREVWWISKMRSDGHKLTNLEAGGLGGGRITEETKSRISAANKGRKPAPHTIAACIASRKGVKASQETLDKMSKAHKGRKPSPPTIAASIKASTGRVVSVETRSKISQSKTGTKRPEHEKQKISDSMKKLKRSEDHDEKLKIRLIATKTNIAIQHLIKLDPEWFRAVLTASQTPPQS